MIAYRSAGYETTGCTPNALLLGREVASPLDIVLLRHQWALESKEKLHDKHNAFGEHILGEMYRHDVELNWEKFGKGVLILSFTKKW
jgi:hypothetical protein